MGLAAEFLESLRRDIPRTPDELPATDVWERQCLECPAIIQGGRNALWAHLCLVHPAKVEYVMGLTDEEFARFAAGQEPKPPRTRRLRAVPEQSAAPVQEALFEL
jgi:hypothetical protein